MSVTLSIKIFARLAIKLGRRLFLSRDNWGDCWNLCVWPFFHFALICTRVSVCVCVCPSIPYMLNAQPQNKGYNKLSLGSIYTLDWLVYLIWFEAIRFDFNFKFDMFLFSFIYVNGWYCLFAFVSMIVSNREMYTIENGKYTFFRLIFHANEFDRAIGRRSLFSIQFWKSIDLFVSTCAFKRVFVVHAYIYMCSKFHINNQHSNWDQCYSNAMDLSRNVNYGLINKRLIWITYSNSKITILQSAYRME